VLADRLDRLGEAVAVESAGIAALDGVPATEATQVAAARLGLDLSSHRSRRADLELVQAADLVITMERHHVREVVVLDPSAFSRAFTLRELVRRGHSIELPGSAASPESRIALIQTGRRPVELLGSSAEDDVEDPTGNRFVDHEIMAREVGELIDQVVELLWRP
jgi:protein-tyrosine phosphatase